MGFLSQGGTVDSLFDPIRSEVGKADSAIQEYLRTRFKMDSERYAVQRVIWVYARGVQSGAVTVFTGTDDSDAKETVEYIRSIVQLDPVFIYNTLYALFSLAKQGNLSCASVLAGSSGNFFDDLMNGGLVNATTNTVNAAFSGLGLPSVANTVVVLGVVGLIAGIVYLNVRKK